MVLPKKQCANLSAFPKQILSTPTRHMEL